MLNNNTNIRLGDVTHDIKFNTTSTGHLQKSNPNSRFIKFQLGSTVASQIFPLYEQPYIKMNNMHSTRIEITVLQSLIFGDNWFLCEIIENSKLDLK